MYKAVFLDLDGTLLDDEKNISNENKEAITHAIKNGAIVCLCSGRQQEFVKEYKENAGASRYVICSNGAEIYDCESHEELFSMNLNPIIVKNLYELVIQNNFLIRLDTKYGRFVNELRYGMPNEVLLNESIDKFLLENNTLQITIVTETEEEIDAIIEYIKGLNRIDIKIENKYRTIKDEEKVDFWAINIINSSASKGNAMNGLCKYLKIDMKDIIAIGDDLNDISMIQMAGLGVAMKNALPVVKENANLITQKNNNENGVAEVLINNF